MGDVARFLEGTRAERHDGLTAEQDDRVTVSTIHCRQKGAEARGVYVLGCEERRLPSSHRYRAFSTCTLCKVE